MCGLRTHRSAASRTAIGGGGISSRRPRPRGDSLLPLAYEGHLFEIAFQSLVLPVLADVRGDQHQYRAGVEDDNDDDVAQGTDTVVLQRHRDIK